MEGEKDKGRDGGKKDKTKTRNENKEKEKMEELRGQTVSKAAIHNSCIITFSGRSKQQVSVDSKGHVHQ